MRLGQREPPVPLGIVPSLPAERSSAAKAFAAPRFPEPDGPTSRYEWTGCAAAAVSCAMAWG